MDYCQRTVCCVGLAIDNINLISVLQLSFLQYQIIIIVIIVVANGIIIIIITLIFVKPKCVLAQTALCQTVYRYPCLFFQYTKLFTHHCLATVLTMFIRC